MWSCDHDSGNTAPATMLDAPQTHPDARELLRAALCGLHRAQTRPAHRLLRLRGREGGRKWGDVPSIDARMVARPGMAHGTGRRARGSYSALRRVLMALCVSACWTDEKVEGEEGDKKHEHHAPRPGRPGSRCKQQPPGSSCLPAAAAAAAVLQQQWPWLHVQQPCRRPGLQSPALTSAALTNNTTAQEVAPYARLMAGGRAQRHERGRGHAHTWAVSLERSVGRQLPGQAQHCHAVGRYCYRCEIDACFDVVDQPMRFGKTS